MTLPMIGVRPMPPPTSTLKPTSPASFFSSCRPMSCQPMAARSSRAPVTAILNLRGRKANSGCSVLHWRRISQYGRGSTTSSGAMPASASLVMLRMQLPLVWMPCMSTSASRSITSAAARQRDPVELQVLARGEVAVAAVELARDARQLAQLAAAQLAVGHGDAQHRRVALHVPAVLQAQRAELVVAAARRPGGAAAGRGTAPRGRARTGGRSRCIGTWSVDHFQAGGDERHAQQRAHQPLGQARVSCAPIQMPGSEPTSSAASSGQSTWPSVAWPMPATRVSGTAWAMSVPTTRLRRQARVQQQDQRGADGAGADRNSARPARRGASAAASTRQPRLAALGQPALQPQRRRACQTWR